MCLIRHVDTGNRGEGESRLRLSAVTYSIWSIGFQAHLNSHFLSCFNEHSKKDTERGSERKNEKDEIILSQVHLSAIPQWLHVE